MDKQKQTLIENFFSHSEIVDLLLIENKLQSQSYKKRGPKDDVFYYLEKLESIDQHSKTGAYGLYSLFIGIISM